MTKSKIFCSAIALFVGTIFAVSAWAQQPAPKLTMKMLKPDVWVGLGGAGGNSTHSPTLLLPAHLRRPPPHRGRPMLLRHH